MLFIWIGEKNACWKEKKKKVLKKGVVSFLLHSNLSVKQEFSVIVERQQQKKERRKKKREREKGNEGKNQ